MLGPEEGPLLLMSVQAWDHWYHIRRWQRRSKTQLRAHPLCAYCLERGLPVVATVTDHVEPHRGDWNSFWLGKVQSLCAPCHNSRKKTQEIRGYTTDIGEDGWPLDPRHPTYRSRGRRGGGGSGPKDRLR